MSEKIHIPEAKLRQLYEVNGLSQREIARILGCSQKTIQSRMHEYGIKARHEGWRGKVGLPEDKLRQLYEKEGLSQARIGMIFGCSQTTVHNRMREYGIKARHIDKVEIPKDKLRQLYEVEELSPAKIGKILRCSESVVRRRMQEYGIKARTYAEAAIIASGYADVRHPFSGDIVEKGYDYGFCVGDASISVEGEDSLTLVISCGSTKPEQIELFISLFSPNGHIYIWKNEEGDAVATAFLDKESFAWLEEMGDYIPADILANPKSAFPCLAGYTDAEGCIDIHNGYARFQLRSCDKNILHQFYTLLVSMGIQCPKPRLSRPKGCADSHGISRNRDLWCLAVYRKSSLSKLFSNISPYLKHPKRIRDMEAAIKNLERRSQIPAFGLDV